VLLEVIYYLMFYFDTDDDDDDADDDDDDDEGWITPSNIDAMKQATIALSQSEVTDIPVACVTTDYAMQVLFYAKLRYCDQEAESVLLVKSNICYI